MTPITLVVARLVYIVLWMAALTLLTGCVIAAAVGDERMAIGAGILSMICVMLAGAIDWKRRT